MSPIFLNRCGPSWNYKKQKAQMNKESECKVIIIGCCHHFALCYLTLSDKIRKRLIKNHLPRLILINKVVWRDAVWFNSVWSSYMAKVGKHTWRDVNKIIRNKTYIHAETWSLSLLQPNCNMISCCISVRWDNHIQTTTGRRWVSVTFIDSIICFKWESIIWYL